MTDQSPVQPDNSGQPAIIDWEARYKGASTKINELTTKLRDLETQLTAKTSSEEQLRTQLGVKDVEKDSAVGEYKKQLEKSLADLNASNAELTKAKATVAKIEMAKKLGAQRLLPIIDRIPFVEDPQALESIMKDFMSWGEGIAAEREKQLSAGQTQTVAAAGSPSPASAEAWMAKIRAMNEGPEKDAAWGEYFKWASAQK